MIFKMLVMPELKQVTIRHWRAPSGEFSRARCHWAIFWLVDVQTWNFTDLEDALK
jgi:hypothetical protein